MQRIILIILFFSIFYYSIYSNEGSRFEVPLNPEINTKCTVFLGDIPYHYLFDKYELTYIYSGILNKNTVVLWHIRKEKYSGIKNFLSCLYTY